MGQLRQLEVFRSDPPPLPPRARPRPPLPPPLGCAEGVCPPGGCAPGCQNAPPVPPPTYKWELVRRDREAGLYPWTYLYKRPYKDHPDSDHEYEPISPPRGPVPVVVPVQHGPPTVHVTNIEGITIQEPPEGPDTEPIMSDNDSAGSPVRRPVEEVPVPVDGDDEDRAMSSGEMGDTNGSLGPGPHEDDTDHDMDDEELTAAQIQQQMEDRFFAPTPTTTESRTDGEFNTSNVDSSGLEDLPLTKKGRKAVGFSKRLGARFGQTNSGAKAGAAPEEAGPSTSDRIQERLRSGAGRLKSKLSGMSRPKMPQVRKPKFTMPSMPDKAKFHLPERPKIKMPEFKMPERPKISLPSLGRSSAGRSNSTKRPLRSRQRSTESTAGSTEKKPLFDFRTYPRMFKKSRARGDQSSSPKSARAATPPPRMGYSTSPDGTSTGKKSLGSKWMHRFTDLKFGESSAQREAKKEVKEVKPKKEQAPTVEASHQSTSKTAGEQVVYHISLHGSDSEIEYSDDHFQGPPYPEILPIDGDLVVVDRVARQAAMQAEVERQTAAIVAAEREAELLAEYHEQLDQDADLTEPSVDHLSIEQDVMPETMASQGDSDRDNRSSRSSSERHRHGVIEEIDSDEFFLRQKGISQEDVDMTRFISSKIREALRPAPPAASSGAAANGFDRMAYRYDDDEEEEDLGPSQSPPSRPQRTRSLRPRKKKGRKAVPATPPGDEAEEEWEAEEQPSEHFNTFPPNRPNRNRRAKQKKALPLADDQEQPESVSEEHRTIEKSIELSVAIPREDLGILALTPQVCDEDVFQGEPPLPPRRLRKSASNLATQDVPMIDDIDDDWDEVERRAVAEEMMALQREADYIIPRATPDSPPVPPTRARKSRSRGTSLADEDRTSRGAESLPSERDVDGELPVDVHLDLQNEDDLPTSPIIDDYAFVDKQNMNRQTPAKPERPHRPKPPRPPAPGRRKRPPQQTTASRLHNWKQFFSLPTRRSHSKQPKQTPPVRPARNYSTLGPSRPPRRGSRGSRDQHVYTAYLEIQDDTSLPERDLQSGEVLYKMKDRPLPAPPRPPRKQGRLEDYEDGGAPEEEEELREVTYEERKAALAAMREDFFSRSGDEPQEPTTAADAVPTITVDEPSPAQEQLPDSPYKSLRKKKKIPPLPVEVPLPVEELTLTEETLPEDIRVHLDETVQAAAPPEEVSIAIQTDPLPDDMCVEDTMTVADEISASRTEGTSTSNTWPTVMEADHTEAAEELPVVPIRKPVRSPRKASHVSQEAAEAPVPTTVQIEVPETLRAERLQVSDLDVERMNVSELKAMKITVSEIDGMSLGVSEIHSKTGSLNLGGVELPSDMVSQLLPLSQSLSHALSQSLSESLAGSLSSTLSQIQEALSQPAELMHQHQQLQEQLQNLQELQRQQQLLQHDQLLQQQQQQLHQQQQLLEVEQQHAALLQELQHQIQHLQLSAPMLEPDAPPPIPPPPMVDGHSIQTQTSLESPPPPEPPRSYSPDYVPGGPLPPRLTPFVPPPRRTSPAMALRQQDTADEEIPTLVAAPSPSHTSSLRRRRHHTAHRTSARYSSDEEEEAHLLAVARRHRQAVPDPSLAEVSRQLVRACRASALNAIAALHQVAQPALDAVGADPKRRELQAALCLVVVLVTALILLGCGCAGSKVVHHHHWDFQFPPPL